MSSRHTRLLVLTLAIMFWAGPAGAQSVLRIGLNDDPDALDPTISRAYTGRLVFAALCDKLFDVTPELKIVPQLATGHEWAADSRSVVIRLRPGVRFHDGEPLNAEAVRFNIERHLTTPGSFRKTEISDIKSVDVVNDLTVRLNLSQPSVPLLATLTDRAGMMVSPKAAPGRYARGPSASSSASPRAGSSSSASPTTGTRAPSTSTVSSSCPSPTPRRGSPACAPATSR